MKLFSLDWLMVQQWQESEKDKGKEGDLNKGSLSLQWVVVQFEESVSEFQGFPCFVKAQIDGMFAEYFRFIVGEIVWRMDEQQENVLELVMLQKVMIHTSGQVKGNTKMPLPKCLQDL